MKSLRYGTGFRGLAAGSRATGRRGLRPRTCQLTDRLHAGHKVCVSVKGIATTLTAWLAELDVRSPLVEDFEHAVCNGDWPTTYAIAEHLSVDIAVAV